MSLPTFTNLDEKANTDIHQVDQPRWKSDMELVTCEKANINVRFGDDSTS